MRAANDAIVIYGCRALCVGYVYVYHRLRSRSHAPRRMATLVPIGCDCHPAYVLQTLHLRHAAYPFDWLDTSSEAALQYVEDNLRSRFAWFLHGLAARPGDRLPFAAT